MGLLNRRVFRETAVATLLGTLLFTFVLSLRGIGQFFELLMRSSASPGTLLYLFGLLLPPSLIFTVPIGVLVGVLLALSRMSGDGEITAMRAAGVSGRRLLLPVGLLALAGMLVAAACTLWLTPWAIRETYRVVNQLAAEQLTAEIQPRVFQEQFPNTILFVADVVPGPVVHWKKVFLAQTNASAAGSHAGGQGPLVTVAKEATAVSDLAHNRIQLSLVGASSYQAGATPEEYYSTSFPRGEQALEAQPPGERRARPFRETDTLPLLRLAAESADARIELHQRLALPPACVLLALLGVPLGVSSRKGGKSGAVVTTLLLAFLYYMGLISMIGLARQGNLPVAAAVWTPNLIYGAAAFWLLARLERPGDRDVLGGVRDRVEGLYQKFSSRLGLVRAVRPSAGRLPLLPQLLDAYVLSSYLLYFLVFLAAFVLMTEVYTFFELLGDIVRNHIPLGRVFTYLFFLAPMLIYDSAPVSAMVAVLVTFGVMAKHNEVTAFKTCGVSLHRLAAPVLVSSLI